MLIIIEGADGAGKSEFAGRLTALLAAARFTDQVEVLHRGPPMQHPLDEYVTPLLGYRPGQGRHIICDRWHLGESVYPAILNRKTRYTHAVRSYVELFLLSRGALLIFIDRPDDIIYENVRRRGDDLLTPALAVAAAQSFRLAYLSTRLTVLRAFRDLPDNILAQNALTLATQLDTMAMRLNPFTTYVGRPQPSYLLLGDVRNTGVEPGDLRPALMPYAATSGHYLLSVLAEDIIDDCGLANACDVDDVDKLREVLGEPLTATLGVNASRSTEYRFGTTLHPQHVRRFHHHHGGEYAESVRRALNEQSGELEWRPS